MSAAERIEELLGSEDIASIQQGLFLLESAESPELLEALAGQHPIEQLLVHDWLASRSGSLSVSRALAQVRVYQLLVTRCPERLAGQAMLEACLRQRSDSLLQVALDLVQPGGFRATVQEGAPAPQADEALSAAAPLLALVGPARCRDVLRIIERHLLDGTIPRSRLPASLLRSAVQHALQARGPWKLMMGRLPDALLSPGCLENLSGLALAGSTCTALPLDGPTALALDTTGSVLEVLPRWVEHLIVDDRGWALWRMQMEQVRTLQILASLPLEVAGASLGRLEALRILAPELPSVLPWLRELPRLERLWLSGDRWTPPHWLWLLPVTQLSLEGAAIEPDTMPPPPPGLERLLLPPDQIAQLPPAWAAIAHPIAEGRRIYLRDTGPRKINLIKLVRQLTSLGLREALERVNSVPCHILTAKSSAEARQILHQLAEVGAVAEARV